MPKFKKIEDQYVCTFLGEASRERAQNLADRIRQTGVDARVRKHMSEVHSGHRVIVHSDDYMTISSMFEPKPSQPTTKFRPKSRPEVVAELDELA